MKFPFLKTLRAPIDDFVQLAAVQCCRRKIPSLGVSRSLPFERRIELLTEWVDKLCARGAFNGTVLIAKGGRICFQRTYGAADDDRAELSNHSSFSLASVSKPFTAMGIMLLALKGKLTLDDKMTRYLPELSDYRDVTVRQLLHHTAGVPDYMELAEQHWDASVVLTMRDVITLFEKFRPPLNSVPGDRFEYSNTGYAFLGEILARASGASYPQFMSDEIFKPLGMKDSAAFNLVSKECPLRFRVFGLHRRFACFGQKVLRDLNYLDGVFGDGGIYASAGDLVRWDTALRDGTLIPCEIYEEAYASGKLNNGEATGYGFGWDIDPPDVVEHWGRWEGFTSYLRRDLKKHTLLVVLSNLGPSACVDAVSFELGAFVEDI
jgi:CubicO group peptidase (beta-lactamase class C family)